MATDPVCGMTVDPTTARKASDYQGTTFYFCSPGCKKAFDADPAAYVDAGDAANADAPVPARTTGGGCACCVS